MILSNTTYYDTFQHNFSGLGVTPSVIRGGPPPPPPSLDATDSQTNRLLQCGICLCHEIEYPRVDTLFLF